MKKNQIYSCVIASLCFLLWFIPTQASSNYAKYVSTIQSFINGIFSAKMSEFFLREYLLVLFGSVGITISIINIFKSTNKLRITMLIAIPLYLSLWTIVIFVPVFPERLSILQSCKYSLSPLWLIVDILIIIAIVILIILQYLPPRQPKAERLEEQVADLQKQIDELKKGE